MSNPDNENFVRIWPKCFITATGVIELIAVIFLFLTELGSVAAHFWYANVFAGGWCGLVMGIHTIFILIAGTCSPNRGSAYRAMLVSVLGAIASAVLVAFDTIFLINPKTCILTPQCLSNAASNSSFGSSLQSSFIVTFRTMDLFKYYTETQSKTLFQAMQVGIGSVCILMSITYIIIFYIHDKKAKEMIRPSSKMNPPPRPFAGPALAPVPMFNPDGNFTAAGQNPYQNNIYPNLEHENVHPNGNTNQCGSRPSYGAPQSTSYYPNQRAGWPSQNYQPQPAPGQIPWNGGSYGY